jgi:hypothetical protein
VMQMDFFTVSATSIKQRLCRHLHSPEQCLKHNIWSMNVLKEMNINEGNMVKQPYCVSQTFHRCDKISEETT